ncbi:MAG TPA: hydroxymethylbilane synthase [Bacteroidetes bacterium]|nr:hydroxymethylbilane synthase [Bacteroidota bacterium]
MTIRIGTRNSALAIWQAEHVQKALSPLPTEIVGISTKGDQDQNTPLHQLGQTGVFTKAIDQALLEGKVDIGVHSLKDYPTQIPEGLALIAVLERDEYHDVFIPSETPGDDFFVRDLLIASGSPRRRAQWLARYPNHRFTELRGNMHTRLERMAMMDGGIVSKAGLTRLGILPDKHITLDWMIPAPAQGIIAIVGRIDDIRIHETIRSVNHLPSFQAATIERDFMAEIEAGCAAPLGALAQFRGDHFRFSGILNSLDGRVSVRTEKQVSLNNWKEAGQNFAQHILKIGGREIMKTLRQP